MKEDYVGLIGFGSIGRIPNPADVDSSKIYHIRNMFNRTQSMFEYKGLPDTITSRNLELLLQRDGYCAIANVKSNNPIYSSGLYALWGTLGGEPDPYRMPSKFVFANAGLSTSGELAIDKDCVVIPNDSLYLGLQPIAEYNAYHLSHAYITLRIALINTRLSKILSAADDDVYEACKEYIKKIENGSLAVIKDTTFQEIGGFNVSMDNSASNSDLTKIIEVIQFIKGSWFNDIGLQSNYNMKRETLTSSEVALNNDILSPLIDNMLFNRRQAIEKINKMFGVNWSVELNSSWKNNFLEEKIELKNLNKLSNQVDNSSDNKDEKEIDNNDTE